MIQKFTFLLLLAIVNNISSAQTNPGIPKPPTEQLNKFEHLYGKWQMTSENYNHSKLAGTMEMMPSIKGWYVETFLRYTIDGQIDLENRRMLTWDEAKQRYRNWIFGSGPPMLQMEGRFRLDGETYIEEWDAAPGIVLRHKIRLVNQNEFEMITERLDPDGKVTHIGLTKGVRSQSKK